jgi:hypothetical protein
LDKSAEQIINDKRILPNRKLASFFQEHSIPDAIGELIPAICVQREAPVVKWVRICESPSSQLREQPAVSSDRVAERKITHDSNPSPHLRSKAPVYVSSV